MSLLLFYYSIFIMYFFLFIVFIIVVGVFWCIIFININNFILFGEVSFIKRYMEKFFNSKGSVIKNSVSLTSERIFKENAFILFSIKIFQDYLYHYLKQSICTQRCEDDQYWDFYLYIVHMNFSSK